MRWLPALCLLFSLGCDEAPVAVDTPVDGMDSTVVDATRPDSGVPDVGIDLAIPDAEVDVAPLDPSHDKDGPPNYDVVFPQDRVNRIDLICTPNDWAALQMDLQALTGIDPVAVPPSPQQGHGMIPPPWIAACDAVAVGEACETDYGAGVCVDAGDVVFCEPDSGGPEGLPPGWLAACVDLQGGDVCAVDEQMGRCIEDAELGVFCLPDSEGPPSLPPEATTACEGLSFQDPCTAPFPGEEEGLCVPGPNRQALVCIPQAWLGGGPGRNSSPYAAASFWERKPAYIPCELHFEDGIWRQIGVRYKGNSTLAFSTGQTRKLPLRFKMDAFEDEFPETKDQRFYGFNHLTTVNQIMDSSFLRQKLMADAFRAAGVPSPQTAFYRIYIDHGEGAQYFGLYTLTEVVRKPMLAAQFGDDTGNLYKCDGTGARFKQFFAESFHRKTHKKSDDYSDVEAFIAALNAPKDDAAAWRSALEATFDMDGFIRFLAVNQALVNWDTYGALAHNYLLYGDPSDGGRLKWIPWDFDLSLQDRSSLDLSDASPAWPLLKAVQDDPVYFARYRALMTELGETALDMGAIADSAQLLHALIEPYVTGAEGEEPYYTALGQPQDFVEGLDSLVGHLLSRQQAVQRFLR